MNVTGLRCRVCGAEVDIATPLLFRCPNATAADRHHVLEIQRRAATFAPLDDPNPYVAFDEELAWSSFAAAHGLDLDRRVALVRELDEQLALVDGRGFRFTPFGRADRLSDALGFAAGAGVWVKDETGNVGGSHKARHLVTILLHLLAAEELGLVPWSPGDRPPLAISSCGNAALAAATLAAAAPWPLVVFVPPWANPTVTARLTALGATVRPCPRQSDDPPGDPCLHRFHEAVEAGALPFSVQGPESVLCLDGGRTLGWEVRASGLALDRAFAQVGGGAFAACLGAAWAGVEGPRLHAVQAEGCAPLARAWERARSGPGGVAAAAARWGECMWPWDAPASLADGILDDETYDWLAVVDAMAATGGSPVVAPETLIAEAHQLAVATTGIRASATGTAGLAGLLAIRAQVADSERVLVALTGIER